MQFRKPVTASACLFSVGLLAAGCSSSSSSSSSAATSSASTSQAATQASAATATAQAAGTTTACTVSVLDVSFGSKTGSDAQATQTVVLTNKGSATCTMHGFPGVNLVGTVNGQKNYPWPLRRSSATYSTVTLASGASAHFDLVYLPFAAGDGTEISVTQIVLTPPNTTTHVTLAWTQPVLLQDAATRPGTWITPVTAGT